MITRYYTYRTYLQKRYHKPAYRVGVDAGFSCPNRDIHRHGGCSYCDEYGATAVYHRHTESGLAQSGDFVASLDNPTDPLATLTSIEMRKHSITEQINDGIDFLRTRYKAERFMLYFQAYSNTYGSVPELREIYDFSLEQADFSELIIATRPDCIDKKRVALISSYREQKVGDVWVELGLQSSQDRTLKHIGRGHTVKQFCDAFALLRKAGIKISIHLILGLPGEHYADLFQTAELITRLHPEAVKIHNLHIPVGTRMYKEYLDGEIQAPSAERHLSYTIYLLEHIPSDIIIQRLICDTPLHRLAAPVKFLNKGKYLGLLQKELTLFDTWQGKQLGERCYGI